MGIVLKLSKQQQWKEEWKSRQYESLSVEPQCLANKGSVTDIAQG